MERSGRRLEMLATTSSRIFRAPERAVETALGKPDQQVAEHHWVKDVGVQERGRESQAASLVVDAEFLRFGDEPSQRLLRLLVPSSLVGEQVL